MESIQNAVEKQTVRDCRSWPRTGGDGDILFSRGQEHALALVAIRALCGGLFRRFGGSGVSLFFADARHRLAILLPVFPRSAVGFASDLPGGQSADLRGELRISVGSWAALYVG